MNYKRIYHDIINHRRLHPVCDVYTEKHHIIPRSLGGNNNKENIVNLTAKEHYVVHLLLTKMYDEKTKEWYKMIKAFMMMSCKSNTHSDKRYTGRIHESYRTRFSDTMKYLQAGDKNSNYGMRWIFSIDEKRTMKVSKDYVISDGWFEGRVIDFEGISTVEDLADRRKYKSKMRRNNDHPQSYKRRSEDSVKYIHSLYDEYQNSGMKLVDYAKKIGKSHSVLSSWFLSYIEEYKTNARKPIMCRDERMCEAVLLYDRYINGGYQSLRDFKTRANISISIMTMSKWFREYIPNYNKTYQNG